MGKKEGFLFQVDRKQLYIYRCRIDDDAHLPLLQGVKICQVGNRTLLNKTDLPDIHGHDEQPRYQQHAE